MNICENRYFNYLTMFVSKRYFVHGDFQRYIRSCMLKLKESMIRLKINDNKIKDFDKLIAASFISYCNK